MRNISFAFTIPQFLDRSKTVTRRLGWKNLKVGEALMGCRQCMGLQRGESIERLGPIRVKSKRFEPLYKITQADVIAEGFPEMTIGEFVSMFCRHHKCSAEVMVTRIEFEYLTPEPLSPSLADLKKGSEAPSGISTAERS